MGHMTTLAPLARCTTRGCPWRFTTGGPDRPCPACRDDRTASLVDRAAVYGAVMTAAPARHDSSGSGQSSGHPTLHSSGNAE
jgi:hypothetical protein